MEYNGVLTLKVGASTHTPVDYSMDWHTAREWNTACVCGREFTVRLYNLN